jgi:hypothetical protein
VNVLGKIWQTTKRENQKKKLSNSDAEFIGWQNTPTGEVFALYNITAEKHPSYHSTVSEKTLLELNLKVPQIPSVFNNK